MGQEGILSQPGTRGGEESLAGLPVGGEGSSQSGQAHPTAGSGAGSGDGECGKVDQWAWPHAHGLPGKVLEAHTWSYADPYLHKHGVRIILECLRELGALGLPMKVVHRLESWLKTQLKDQRDKKIMQEGEQHSTLSAAQVPGDIISTVFAVSLP
eukprot:scaffold169159_cov20-Tisochrysis_lutea.AAC.1